MKKFFYSVLAAATMLLATTSCSQEEEMLGGGTVDNGTTQKVTFTVQLPGDDAASRAIADGVTVGKGNMADKLIWALYESTKTDEDPVMTGLGEEKGYTNEGHKYFEAKIDMVKGLEYKVLFLAYNEANPAFDVAEGDDLKSLTLKNTLKANQESYDAFTACHTHVVKNGEVVTEVTLTRPFAQVNAATTEADLTRSKNLKAVVTKSELVIKQVPTQFNVLTGETSVLKDLTFIPEAILTKVPAVAEGEHPNEDIKVENTDYKYLTLAYVLAGEKATSEKSMHNATFNFYRGDNGDDLMRNIDIINLPIQRNWRTNVIGDLLTETEGFKIVIDERFTGDHNVDGDEEAAETTTVATAQELQAAIDAATGPTIIKFEQDIDANSSRSAASITVLQKEGVDLVIDGCDYKFNGTFYIFGDSRHTGTETLTFKNIKFEGYDNYINADFRKVDDNVADDTKVRYAHNVTIDNCSFVGTNQDAAGMYFRQAYNITVKNTTATGLYSLMWADGTSGITFDNVTVSACKEGAASFGTSTNVVVKNSTITLEGNELYGISADGNNGSSLVVENSTIKASTPVFIRMNTMNYEVKLEGENTLTPSGKYHVVFAETGWKGNGSITLDNPTGTWSITGADNLNVFPREVLVTDITELQDALNNDDIANIVIKFGANINGDAVVTERENNNVVIDGCEFEYDGQIKIKGNSDTPENCKLLIKNINFKTSTASREFIWSADSSNGSFWRYAENVTIENCTFTAVDGSAAVHTAVGAKFQQAYNIKVVGCTATNMHTLLQAESCGSNVSVEGSEVINGKNGVSFNNTKVAKIANTIINAAGADAYGVRVKGEVVGYGVTIENCNITAKVPVLVRNMKANGYTIAFEGNNTLTTSMVYQVVISNIDYSFVTGTSEWQPLVAPTGTYTLTGAENFNVYPMEAGAPMNASSNAQLTAVINAGATSVKLTEGTYSIPTEAAGKALTITGTEETIIKTGNGNNSYVGLGTGSIKFDGVTIQGQSSGQYNGFAHAGHMTYNNCTIEGTVTIYSSSTFTNCTFNLPKECYVWTAWGAAEVTYEKCTFNTAGKALLVYHENGTSTVNVHNCVFNATEGAKAGDIANQNCAAIEIANYGKGVGTNSACNFTVNTSGNTYSDYFSGEWRIKGIDTTGSITVNGENYTNIALDGKKMTIDAAKNVTVVE